MQHVGQFAAFHLPTYRKVATAARSDMFGGKKERGGKAAPSDISTGKRGTNAIPVPSACLRYEKKGKQLHLPVDEKVGNLHFVGRCLIEAFARPGRYCR